MNRALRNHARSVRYCPPRHHRRLDHEDGFVGGAEAMLFGVVVLAAGTMLVANVWAVIDAKVAVTAASREAARVLVESSDPSNGRASAVAAATAAMGGHNRSLSSGDISFSIGRFGRCARVTVTVRYAVPAKAVPWWGGLRPLTVASRHSEVIDPYRSGLSGEADCADADG